MAKISVEVGHGGNDVGAVTKDGKAYEKNINLIVALELKRQLERHGQEVLISRETDCDDLARDFFVRAKAWRPDLHVSIHTNAFNGSAKGFEVFKSSIGTFKTRSGELCSQIETQVKMLGQTSRGIKDSPFLLSTLPCVSAYCELGFMDNPNDYEQYDTIAKQKNFADAYAKGILKYLGRSWQQEDRVSEQGSAVEVNNARSPMTEKTIFRVITGSFSDRKNAERRIEELKKMGIESFLLLGSIV